MKQGPNDGAAGPAPNDASTKSAPYEFSFFLYVKTYSFFRIVISIVFDENSLFLRTFFDESTVAVRVAAMAQRDTLRTTPA